jgi:hypothetical protein
MTFCRYLNKVNNVIVTVVRKVVCGDQGITMNLINYIMNQTL